MRIIVNSFTMILDGGKGGGGGVAEKKAMKEGTMTDCSAKSTG